VIYLLTCANYPYIWAKVYIPICFAEYKFYTLWCHEHVVARNSVWVIVYGRLQKFNFGAFWRVLSMHVLLLRLRFSKKEAACSLAMLRSLSCMVVDPSVDWETCSGPFLKYRGRPVFCPRLGGKLKLLPRCQISAKIHRIWFRLWLHPRPLQSSIRPVAGFKETHF